MSDLASMNPIAIVGIGCLFPKAATPTAYWANIKNGVDAIGPVPPSHWNPDDYFDSDPKSPDRTYAQRGGFLDPIPFAPAEFGIAPTDLEATDTSQLLGLVAARDALRDAKVVPSRTKGQGVARERISVILGVTGTLELVVPLGARLGHPHWKRALREAGVDPETAQDVVQRISDAYVSWQENSFPGLLGNVVAGRIANRLDLGGTNCVVDAACASSLSAIHLASLELAAGRADVAITGGVDTFNDIFMYMCFSKTPALSPTGDARPFSNRADGTILGEGLGLVVLKRLEDARKQGDRIYAIIRAIGTSSDGKGNAVYAPTVDGQVACLQNAYELAGVSPGTVELVEAHGTGTKIGDATEVEALTHVYSAVQNNTDQSKSHREGWCALGSVKSQIGHTKAAAGAAGLIKAALSLYHKVLPPSLKIDKPHESLQRDRIPFYVNTVKRPWLPSTDHPRRAAVSAFGFGGSNFHAVLEESDSRKLAVDWDGSTEILAFSDVSRDRLRERLEKIAPKNWNELRELAFESRVHFQFSHPERVTLVVRRSDDLQLLVKHALDSLSGHQVSNVYSGSGSAPGQLALLFPGQGSQYLGMLRDLACQFPGFLDALTLFDQAWGGGLVEVIYPRPAFDDESLARQEGDLRATQHAQPALGAVELGTLRVLQLFGIRADATAGHSYGELVALHAAGCFDETALAFLSKHRGRLMSQPALSGDAGGMLAVMADRESVERVLRSSQLPVLIANHNSPQQVVLSGPSQDIDSASRQLVQEGLRCVRLPVAAAFHSPLVAKAEQAFLNIVKQVSWKAPAIPVYSNTTAHQYSGDPTQSQLLLASQLAKPVLFADMIAEMDKSGIRTYLEIGPGSVLTKLVNACLTHLKSESKTIALDSSGGRNGVYDLAVLLARLAARGHTINLNAWQNDPDVARQHSGDGKPTLLVPISGANYVKPKSARPARALVDNGRSHGAAPLMIPKKPEITPRSETQQVAEVTQVKQFSNSQLTTALQVTQESLAAFQKMQEQVASLHRQFLEGQESAQRTFQRLIEQQQNLLLPGLGTPAGVPPSPNQSSTDKLSVPVETRQLSQLHRATSEPLRNGQNEPTSTSSHQGVTEIKKEERQLSAPVQFASKPQASTESPSLASSHVQEVLLSVVSDKTGYPTEMLELGMGLDADLGIDSIKRVEILAALQERLPDAPVVKPEHLGTLHTLQHIVDFLTSRPSENSRQQHPISSPKLASPAEGSSQLGTEVIQEVLLSVVSDKTGYPTEMLELDMGLDTDLGIDSIKRVEILAALQERLPDAPVVKPEHLGTLHTLQHIVDFLAGHNIVSVVQHNPLPDCRNDDDTNSTVLTRGVLTLQQLEANNRETVALSSQSHVVLIGDEGALKQVSAAAANRWNCQLTSLPWSGCPSNLPATRIDAIILIVPDHGGESSLLVDGFRWIRHWKLTQNELSDQHLRSMSIVVQGLGNFGLGRTLDDLPVMGLGFAGLVKSAQHEWPNVLCKFVDWDRRSCSADELIAELGRVGPTEVGLARGVTYSPTIIDCSQSNATDLSLLSRDEVVVVAGGARGVTAAASLALSKTYKCTLVLLGRTPLLLEEPSPLQSLVTEADIKRYLHNERGGLATPLEINRECLDILASREVRNNLHAFHEAGGRAIYHQIDITDSHAVIKLLNDIRTDLGPIVGVVHGAGILADKKVEDKTDDQLTRVLDTKIAGFKSLLDATQDDSLKFLAVFSSSTGRFGRAGQSDYAMANEVMNAMARQESNKRSNCRVVSFNWGPWNGGMVTPSLGMIFASEGIGLIPPSLGGSFFVAELAQIGDPSDVIVIAPPSEKALAPYSEMMPKIPRALSVNRKTALECVFEREISIATHPVLRSHVIKGRAVVPLAIIAEWMAHTALHGNPGLVFHGIDDLTVLNGLQIDEEQVVSISLRSGPSVRDGMLHKIPIELHGRRKDGKEQLHSRSTVILTTTLPSGHQHINEPSWQPYTHPMNEIYQSLLFHGDDLQAIEDVQGLASNGIVAQLRRSAPPVAWMQHPMRTAWVADPLILDGAFQLAILWSFSQHEAGSLPSRLAQYRQFVRTFPSEGVRCVVIIDSDQGTLARANIEFRDRTGAIVAAISRYEFVIDPLLNDAFRRNRLPERAVI